jgi:hypothetical protein
VATNETQTQHAVIAEENDLGVYIRVYRELKDSFRSRTRFVILFDEVWEVRLVGLTSREWLEFCANVFAELPSETVNLVEEAVNIKNTAADFINEVGFETEDESEVDDDGALEDAAAEEEEYEDDDTEDEEELEEDSVNSDGETPEAEVQRKLRKAKIVRKTGSSAVTVESD